MATRYWVGGGSSSNWNATGNTNWGTASGVQDNASVPTSVDDVIFDGAGTGGNSASIISATITVKSLTITTGYTSTMTHNAELTIAGNWTFVNTYTISGTGRIVISATSTITSNGRTWPNALTFSGASAVITLASNMTANGLVTTSAATTINRTTAETLTTAGGLTVSAALSGTAKVILTGGTWSGNNRIINDIDINGNITISGTVKFGGSNFNYLSGSVTTTSSTFFIETASTPLTMSFNSNGITWNNFTIDTGLNQLTLTLTSDLTINGLFTANSFNGSINKTTNQRIYANGGYLHNSYVMVGTADLYLQGGTITGSVRLNTFINGNITFATSSLVSSTKTYLSGTISQTGVLSIGNVTLDMKQSVFPGNVSTFVDTFGTYIITLLSDLNIAGTLTFADSFSSFNTSNASKVNALGGVTHFKSNGGTVPIYIKGGVWNTTSTNSMTSNVFIDGNVTIIGNIYYGTNTFSYLSGNVKSINAILNLTSSSTLLNVNKIAFSKVIITAAQNITMNIFFSGTPSQICDVSSTGANYTITFQDGFEKMGRFVSVAGATLSRPLQLILLNSPRWNTNRNSSIGIRYYNQSPNGIPRNAPSINDRSATGYFGGLQSDPNFIKQ